MKQTNPDNTAVKLYTRVLFTLAQSANEIAGADKINSAQRGAIVRQLNRIRRAIENKQ